MEAAQAAIARHTSRRGHFTHVEEIVRPAITSETVKPHRHEITTEALDREVHQHHYHTTVQPLSHIETLPTRHTHNLIPVKKTTHEHDDVEENRRRLAEFAALFRDISTTLPTTHSTEAHAAVVGEHVHHHVHETVQPIVYKETIQRETVHTTIPIHEVVHQKARHHGLSSMPVKTMEEFLAFHAGRKDGEVRHSRHEGAPREYDSQLATTFEKLGIVSPAAASTTTPMAAPVTTPKSATGRTLPPAINTTTSPTTTTTTTSIIRNPSTPTRKPFRKHHDTTNHGLTSPNTRGSFSSDSSVSSSAPSTPNSPTYRNNMLPKNNVMNTMPLNKETMGPNTHVNTQTNTMVNTMPAKTTTGNEPVRIVRNSGEGEMSPRYSSDEATTGARRSFLGRLSGSRRSQRA